MNLRFKLPEDSSSSTLFMKFLTLLLSSSVTLKLSSPRHWKDYSKNYNIIWIIYGEFAKNFRLKVNNWNEQI